MKKRLIASALVLALLLTLAPTVSALDPTPLGENLTWTFDAATGTLTISGEGAMEEFYTAPWQAHAEAITTAVIGEGVTSVSSNAFYDCTALTSVQLPESLTSIGISAFYGCSALTSIHIPEAVTSIGSSAFYGCTSLVEVTGAENVVETGEHIFDEAPLDAHGDFIIFGSTLVDYVGEGGEVVIPDGVTYVHGSVFFNEHDTVTSVVFPEGVETIKLGTFNSAKVTSVTLPASLKTIEGGAFYACMTIKDVYYAGTPEQWSAITVGYQNDNLLTADIHFSDDTSANISEPEPPAGIVRWSFDEETGVMTVSGSAVMEDFWYRTDPGRPGCELVTELVIEDGVQSIGDYAFAGFSQITSVTIPDSVTSIGEGAFAGCTSLETIYIGSGVTEMGFMVGSSIFSHVSDFYPEKAEHIHAIYVDEDNPAFSDIDGVLFSKELSTLVYYPRGREAVHYSVPNGVTTIADSAFNYNMWQAQYTPAIETVYLPASVTEIAEFAFGEGVAYKYRAGDRFYDVSPDAWYHDTVCAAADAGIVAGNADGTFAPDGTLTWAQTVTFATRIAQYNAGEAVYTAADQTGAWYQIYVDYALAHGIIDAMPSDPNIAVTRGDAAVIFAAVLGDAEQVNDVAGDYFTDVTAGSAAYDAVYALARAGIVNGKLDTQSGVITFGTADTFKRSEVAAIVARMADLVPKATIQ